MHALSEVYVLPSVNHKSVVRSGSSESATGREVDRSLWIFDMDRKLRFFGDIPINLRIFYKNSCFYKKRLGDARNKRRLRNLLLQGKKFVFVCPGPSYGISSLYLYMYTHFVCIYGWQFITFLHSRPDNTIRPPPFSSNSIFTRWRTSYALWTL